MKKFAVILAVFVMAFFVVSCGGGSSEPADGGDTDTNEEKPADTDTDTSDSDTGAETPDTATDTTPETDTDSNDTDTTPSDPTDTDADTTPVDGPCTEGETRVGETVCGSTQHGKLYQVCKDGDWEDTEKCTCDPGEYPEVCGYYGQKMWFTSSSKVATIDLAEGWTRTYFHIVQEQEQDKVHIKATYCNIKIDNSASGLLQVIMPQSFADALGTADKESYITKNDDNTFGFDQDIFWEIRGIDPACYGDNPAGYTLPTNSADPCVQDWDNDGDPGLTVSTKGSIGGTGTMSMVEKSSSIIHDGSISEDGKKIDALVSWTDEQKILRADNPLLKGGSDNKIKDSSEKFDGPANFIEQVKIEDGSDCAFIVNNAETIFSPDPVTLK
jgi:hypothetical protein